MNQQWKCAFFDRSRAEVQDQSRETESGGREEGEREEGQLCDGDGEKQQLSSASPWSRAAGSVKETAATMSRTTAISTCTNQTQNTRLSLHLPNILMSQVKVGSHVSAIKLSNLIKLVITAVVWTSLIYFTGEGHMEGQAVVSIQTTERCNQKSIDDEPSS